MAIYNSFKTLVWPLNVVKRRVTSAFGLIGGQASGGPGNEGIDAAVWIQERIDDGTIVTSGAGLADGNKGEITVSGGGTTWTVNSNAITTPKITDGAVTNAKAATMAANTVKVRNAATTGVPVDMAVPANTLVGRGSTGDIVPITLGTNLSMAAGVLNATSGSGAGISEVEVGSTLIRYVTLTGTPVFTANIASGVQTITASGGTYKLVSVTTIGATANLAGDNSFTIVYNGVPGTTLLAYPDVTKWNLSGSAPSTGVPDLQDVDSNPQIQLVGGVAGTSVTIKVINMNVFTNWAVKSNW